eukprot:9766115-Heterocapsa_arctica.AAC.1
MEEKGKSYFQERRDGKSIEMVGSPHLHVWSAMMNSIVETCSPMKLSPAAQHDLKQVRYYSLQTFQPSDVQDMVHVCRLTRAYKEGIGKIILSVNSTIACVLGAVLRLLV